MSDFQEKREAQLKPTTAPWVGCAGWSIPKSFASSFPESGSHLERYAARLNGVEINSSFYRPHRVQTYAKWAANVPDTFRFAVKVPKSITHENRLKDTDDLLDAFLTEVSGLGYKLGPLLVQLPPSLRFEDAVAQSFFSNLRGRFAGSAELRREGKTGCAVWCIFDNTAEGAATGNALELADFFEQKRAGG